MEPKKRIKILTPGLISVLGGIYGPILTPYLEKESVIFKLVAAGIKVVEVLDNGKEVELSVSNFKTDNDNADKKTNRRRAEAPAPAVEEVEELVDALKDEMGEEVEVPNGDVNDQPAPILVTEADANEAPVSEELVAEEKADEAPVETKDDDVKAEPEEHNPNYNNYNKHNKNNKKR